MYRQKYFRGSFTHTLRTRGRAPHYIVYYNKYASSSTTTAPASPPVASSSVFLSALCAILIFTLRVVSLRLLMAISPRVAVHSPLSSNLWHFPSSVVSLSAVSAQACSGYTSQTVPPSRRAEPPPPPWLRVTLAAAGARTRSSPRVMDTPGA